MATKQKPSIINTARDEAVFIVHIGIMLAYFLSGFFLALPWVIVCAVVLQVQSIIFKGCIITNYQHAIGSVPKDSEFIPFALTRMTGIKLSPRGIDILFIFISLFPVAVALIKNL